MNGNIKIKIKGHPDPNWKEWFNDVEFIEVDYTSPQSISIYPLIRSVDYRSTLLKTKITYTIPGSDTFGERMKTQAFRNNNGH